MNLVAIPNTTVNDQDSQTSSVPRRRRFQFGLGTLLVSMAVFSIWLGVKVNRANSQRRAVAVFEPLRLKILYDYQQTPSGGYSHLSEVPGPRSIRERIGDDYFRTVFMLSTGQNSDRVTDEQFAYVAAFPDIRVLHLRGTDLTDIGLAHVATLRQVRTLVLTGKITDDGLMYLAGLRNLEVLDLCDNQIAGLGFINLQNLTMVQKLYLHGNPIIDDGLAQIAGLKNVQHLGLANTQVTDAGLEHLTSRDNLKYLCLSNTKVTDAGLSHLETLTSLQTLELSGTVVTDDGKAAIQRMLPKCKITGVGPPER